MRKRILPSLLAFALLLSMMPIAFAAPVPMTLVQETTGDPNQEFVYYISQNSVDNILASNVSALNNITYYLCTCGFVINSDIPNWTDIVKEHNTPNTGCMKSDEYGKRSYYKVILKNGQKATMNVKLDAFTVTTIQDNQYSISYSTDGKNFANYVNNTGVGELDKTIATIKITAVENGTLTIRRTSANAPADVPTNTNPYKDVSTGDWFYPAVEYMSGKKYMTGYSDTEFGPNDTLSRAMFVTILYRASGEKVNANGTKYTDVPQNIWYTEAVAWAVANGITSGTGDTTFSPDDPVTREQMATFMKRYIDRKGIRLPERTTDGSPADLSAASGWAIDAVEAAYKYGILYATYNKLDPLEKATRTDAVVAFYNLLRPSGNGLLLPQTEACTHNWTTRHVAEVGHYEESNGTHMVMVYYCNCGEVFFCDNPDTVARWHEHHDPFTGCEYSYRQKQIEVPNEQQYIIDTPAHDETYCTICGAVK